MKGNVKIVRSRENVELLKSEDVLFCCAEGSYTVINLKGGRKELVSINLKNLEKQFDEDFFLRIHRSYCVNLNEIDTVFVRKNELVLSNGFVLPISRRRKALLLSHLELLSFT